jgi:hypothetical protein
MEPPRRSDDSVQLPQHNLINFLAIIIASLTLFLPLWAIASYSVSNSLSIPNLKKLTPVEK